MTSDVAWLLFFAAIAAVVAGTIDGCLDHQRERFEVLGAALTD